jgi:hypothetical protein
MYGGGPERTFVKNGEDVIVLGSTMIYPMDSIAGDVIFAGGEFTFTGSAGGDYLGAGGSQKIGGRIHGSLRVTGGEIHALGTADRNATIAGGNVALDSTGVIGGNAYIVGGNVAINGAVRGSLMASGGKVVLNGPVGRDVDVSGGELHLGPHAQIAGNFRYRVPKDKVTIDPAARISGTTTAIPVSRRPGLGSVLWMLGFVVVGIVLVALFPRFTTEAAEILPQRPGRSALVGLGWTCLVPIAAVIAAVTVIGIPLGILLVTVWFLMLFLGDLPVALWLGKRLLSSRAGPGRRGAILSVLIGGLILMVLLLIPVVGGWITGIASVFGAGAILLRAWAARAAQPAYGP